MAERLKNKQGDLREAMRRKSVDFVLDGKLPPQAPDLEEAVLGAMMLEKQAPEKVLDILKEHTFYSDVHREIFVAIKHLYESGNPVDILTVTDQLRKEGKLELAGGAYYITKLTNKVSSAANIEYHARILIQKQIQRELIRISGEIGRRAFDEQIDAFELLDEAEKNLFSIKDESIKRNYSKIDDLISKAIKQIESITSNEGLTGVPSGFTQLDHLTSGWQNSDLVIIAGRPGMGKTAFVLTIARNAAVDHKLPVAIFSLEMSSIQLVTRLIAGEAEITSDKLKKGNLQPFEWEQLNANVARLSEAPLYIDDTPALSIFDLKAKARRLKKHQNIALIIIDYLQLMKGDDKNIGNREQEISYISRSLKELAKELDVPVITLAQLSREVEKRSDKLPILSDLRESGSIEQDADIVGFIYRPEYYKIYQDAEGNDLHGIGQIIIEKHRNGPTGKANLKFRGEFAKFSDLDPVLPDYDPSISEPPRLTFGSKMNEDDAPF